MVRGGWDSGNVAAAGLAAEGLLGILSSDYYPASLWQAVKMISLAPAKASVLPRIWSRPQPRRASVSATSRATSEEGVLMAGRLIYLIGPSGSGKDSLLDAARPRLAERRDRKSVV